jgi:hypothetical protein
MQNINFIFLWRENDWGLYRRRNECLLYEFSKKDSVQSILHIEALTLKSFLGLIVRWWQAKDPNVKQIYRLHFKKTFSLKPILTCKNGKIYIYNLIILKYGENFFLKAINSFLIKQQTKIINKKFVQSKRNVILIAYPPAVYLPEAVNKIKHEFLIADLVDDVIARTENLVLKRKYIEVCKDILPKCDWIFSTSPSLKEYKCYTDREIEFLPNGVDQYEFSHAFHKNVFKNNNRKTIGYVGSLNHLLDLDVLEYVIAYYPQTDFVLIGRIQREFSKMIHKIINRYKNCYYLGERKYSDIPSYLLSFDVLVSFKKADFSTRGNDSMKIYQYLLSGKPVVTLPLTPADRFADLVYIATDKYQFVKNLKQALDENDPELREKRIKAAAENTWEKRADIILSRISTRITDRD